MIKVAINGFGRIGRAFLKVAWDRPEIEIVAVNDLGDVGNMAYLLKYDTVYRNSPLNIRAEAGDEPALIIDGKRVKFLSEEEVFKMLDFINADKSEFGIKLSCMFEILYAAGLRVSELVSLPISAIQEITDENGEKTLRNYLIVKGKGSKERIAPINKSAIKMLIEYLDLRKKLGYENSKWLFVGKVRARKKSQEKKHSDFTDLNSHITRQRLHQMLKELALKVGIDPSRIHPHVIRHSFATHLLNSGVDLRLLQELLGHSNISTTEIYTHILDSKLKELVFNHHPLSKNFT